MGDGRQLRTKTLQNTAAIAEYLFPIPQLPDSPLNRAANITSFISEKDLFIVLPGSLMSSVYAA